MKILRWGASPGRKRVRAVALGVVGVLLVISVSGTVRAFASPLTKSVRVPLFNYEHTGTFEYVTHVKPGTVYSPGPTGDMERPPIFSKLVEAIDLSFSYRFAAGQPVDEVTSEVEMVAVVESPRLWRKEMTLVPRTPQTGDFIVEFPLDLAEVKALATKIDEETGVRGASHSLSILARVYCQASAGPDVVEDEFQQALEVKDWRGTTLEWGDEFSLTKVGTHERLNYRQSGRFDYAVRLKPNTVYGPIVMTSSVAAAPATPVALDVAYATRSIDWVDVTFSSRLKASTPVRDASRVVSVTATLRDEKKDWTQTAVLVPETQYSDDFSVTFPLDPKRFTGIVAAAEKKGGTGFVLFPALTVGANVRAVFQTDLQRVDEVYSQSVGFGVFDRELKWSKELVQTIPRSITKEEVTRFPEVADRRRYWSIASGSLALLCLYLARPFAAPLVRRLRQRRSAEAQSASRVEKKRRDIIVDVIELPDAISDGNVIRVSTLNDLITLSDAFLKPVLRRRAARDAGPWRYYVFDGSTRYEYLLGQEPSPVGDRGSQATG